MTNYLSDNENILVSCLRKSSTGRFQQISGNSSGESMKERFAKRPRLGIPGTDYIDCRFVLGSVAQIEPFWSLAKYIYTDIISRLSPQMFEALLFLKEHDFLGP